MFCEILYISLGIIQSSNYCRACGNIFVQLCFGNTINFFFYGYFVNVNCTENSKKIMKLHHNKKIFLMQVTYSIIEWIRLEGTTGCSAVQLPAPSRIL